jgi:hypothetical protein
MGQVRNDTGEIRVLPTADYSGVKPGGVVEVNDEDVYHWVAGGWTPLSRYPVPYRLYPNHQHDPLAFSLPEPPEDDPSAIAVGEPHDAAPQPAAPAPQQTPAAAAPVAASEPSQAAPAGADPKEQ